MNQEQTPQPKNEQGNEGLQGVPRQLATWVESTNQDTGETSHHIDYTKGKYRTESFLSWGNDF